MAEGTVYWLTGVPGAGKSTLARLLVAHLRERGRPCLLLDGDELRTVLAQEQAFAPAQRLALAMTYGRLCKLVAGQGHDVVCATVSLFHACQAWNREQIGSYVEILIAVPDAVLQARDQKGLYSGVRQGLTAGVTGLDQAPEWPLNPDLIVNNDGSQSPEQVLAQILNLLKLA